MNNEENLVIEQSDHNPVLSIVIVNSDGNQVTLQCLASIYRYPPSVSFEVILVDNCSIDSTFSEVRSKFPHVKMLSAPEKQGFSRNYNLGIRHSRGDYVLVLNNDTLLHLSALDALIAALRKNSTYAMVGPKLVDANGSIQTVCARSFITPFYYVMIQFFLDLALPTGKVWDAFRRYRLERRTEGPVECLSGACLLVSRETIDRIGLLDEGYDFYYEDIEWCHRVQEHGLQVAYIPSATVTHLGDQSLSKVKEWAKRSEYHSAIRYFQQYHALSNLGHWCIWLATVLGFCFRALAYLLLQTITRKKTHHQAYLNLSRWILKQSPKSYRQGILV
jgi:N-acetylglucosaminyl-diphospho-decaprenol L-rhamnosyltransferase